LVLRIIYFLALCALWLLLSGHQEVFILSLGLLSVLLVVALSVRMGIYDQEGFPLHLMIRAPRYWLWLLKENIKATLDVSRMIIDPRLPISPLEDVIKHELETDLGRSTLANSITLTPGTIATGVDAEGIRIHALTQGTADDLHSGSMQRRVKRMMRRS
jgi:multicomponent Na+:H+ antiporter subunit E